MISKVSVVLLLCFVATVCAQYQYYYLQNVGSNYVIDARSYNYSAGAQIIQWFVKDTTMNQSRNQVWRNDSSGFVYTPLSPNMVLDIEGQLAGAPLILYPKKASNNANQLFVFPSSWPGVIGSQLNAQVLSVADNTLGGPVLTANYVSGNKYQLWNLVNYNGPPVFEEE